MGTPSLLPGLAPRPLVEVPPAEVHPAVHELAEALPVGLSMGPSSWAYPGWGPLVWGRAANETALARYGLAALAAFPLFQAVGVDRTFHQAVDEAQYRAWAAMAPSLQFLVKAPRGLTNPADESGFLSADRARSAVTRPAMAGLGSTLGGVLFQFPASATQDAGGPRRFVDRLTSFLSALGPGCRPVVEVRDPSLVTKRTGDALTAAGALPCLCLQPGLPPVDLQAAALARPGRGLVVRWMTRPGKTYRSAREAYAPYRHLLGADPSTRRALARVVADQCAQGSTVVVTIANRAEGCIPLSAVGLAEAVVDLTRRRGG